MARRPILRLVPFGEYQAFEDLFINEENQNLSLKKVLEKMPALSFDPIDEKQLEWPIKRFLLNAVKLEEVPSDQALYFPKGVYFQLAVNPEKETAKQKKKRKLDIQPESGEETEQAEYSEEDFSVDEFPDKIEEKEAVEWAYAREIDSIAAFLRAGLSVLVTCDKLLVEHFYMTMVLKAGKTPKLLEVPQDEGGGMMLKGQRQRQLDELKRLIKDLLKDDILVIPHLDLIAAGSNSNLPTESRELIEVVYKESNRPVLAFVDRSLEIPEVLAGRFAVRVLISGVHRTVIYPNGKESLIGRALITKEEAKRFKDFDPEGLYKNVAGMNPIRIRHAIHFAKQEFAEEDSVDVGKLYQAIRAFKVQTSSRFEVPKVTFADIGGYGEVKQELERALNLMMGSYKLPDEKLRRELIPRGFIFYGPPGTGKTLFAKAIANSMNATIQVVSGPEVTDMYVGESERKVRELFSEARRNAPSVLVFDEFDSIASQRSGRDDGGSRAGNALVAQILTEMDGFRPDVPMLVIGTTNRLDIIDDALLRPSRFKPIAVDLPTREARYAIAKVHSKHFKIEISDGLLEVIAQATEGMNGDEIRSLFRDACVGQYCMSPPIEPDAHRFGFLVGQLRKAAENKAAADAQKKETSLILRPGQRPQPGSGMVALSGINFSVSDTEESEELVSPSSPMTSISDDSATGIET